MHSSEMRIFYQLFPSRLNLNISIFSSRWVEIIDYFIIYICIYSFNHLFLFLIYSHPDIYSDFFETWEKRTNIYTGCAKIRTNRTISSNKIFNEKLNITKNPFIWHLRIPIEHNYSIYLPLV